MPKTVTTFLKIIFHSSQSLILAIKSNVFLYRLIFQPNTAYTSYKCSGGGGGKFMMSAMERQREGCLVAGSASDAAVAAATTVLPS